MSTVIVKQMPGFKRAYKRLQANEKAVVDGAIKEIIKSPKIGDEKKGDLAGVCVYKFKFKTKEYLLGYEWDPKHRVLLALGVHENFYRDLKKKI